MSNEDKMREAYNNFVLDFESDNDRKPKGYEIWKACAAIKDGEIASRDLMIKELREALDARKSADKYCAMYAHLTDAQEDCAEAQQQADELANEALANSEHHNSRALEKYRITHELVVLLLAASACRPYGEEFQGMITEREAKLAELNKE